jgi:hypothetical protein
MSLDELTDGEAIRTLQEEHGWEVREPTYNALPIVDVSDLYGCTRKSFEYFCDFLTERRVIIDPFGSDHSSRRKYNKGLETENPPLRRWIKGHSKLKINSLLSVSMTFRSLMDGIYTKGSTSWQKAWKALPKDLFAADGYDAFSFEEKVEFVETIGEACYGLLERLAE